jgi:hypothetical protein
MIRWIVATLSFLVLIWMGLMMACPIFFLRHMESKYAFQLKGEKQLSWFWPHAKVQKASFVWDQKVELIDGDFEIEIDPWMWIKHRIWSMRLSGDGARLRFIGDWVRKTGVSEVKTSRLRLKLQFSNEGIHEIDTIDLISPDYKIQIHSREQVKS